MRDGYRRAVDEANAQGGLMLAAAGGRVPVRLVVHDDRAETPRVEEQTTALVTQGAHVLLGTYTSVRATAQAAVAERVACPCIVNSVDAPGLPGPRMSWVFSVIVSGSDLESRAYETAASALATVSRAAALDAAHLRVAFSGM